MTLCLVTDRRRLAGPVAWPEQRRRLMRQLQEAVAAGIDVIQVREPDVPAADLASLVDEVVAAARGSHTRIVVNDRLDVALACGADGVHLRGDSIPPREARRLTPAGFLIGRSVHGLADLPAAAGADYLIAGTVFPTVSKAAATRGLGVEGLRAVVTAAMGVPVLAIGGMTLDRMAEVAGTGAAGVAAIGLFQEPAPSEMPGSAPRPLKDLVQDVQSRFDSLKAAP